ncbi:MULTISPECIES: tail fiber protein [Salinicola]|uniref:phage tail protein n=1 Tax=Salinicola TaxID=404432 RepID=UPI000DA22C28|nr:MULTISPECIES: tail fiber protein [Salinicola]
MDIDSYMGVIAPFAGNFAPRGWMICNGQLLSIAQYSALYSLLGTIYGGDGRTTFGLPNLNGRVAMGGGQYREGAMGGTERTTLQYYNLPVHEHAGTAHADVTWQATATPADASQASANATLGQSVGASGRDPATVQIYAPASGTVGLPAQLQVGAQLAVSGQNQSVDILQPVLTLTQCICIEGIYPPRS